MTFRNAIVPVCNFSYNLGWVAIMIGLFMGRTSIAWIGVLLTSLMLLFQIVTLPVEFDASSRALSILRFSNTSRSPAKCLLVTAYIYLLFISGFFFLFKKVIIRWHGGIMYESFF